MGERALLALRMVNSEAIVELRSAKSVSYMLLSTSLGTTGPLCLARLRGPVWLSQGLGVSHPGREHAEKWPDKHLSAGKGLQGDGVGLQRYLSLSSARLATCEGWIAVFPTRTLLAFGEGQFFLVWYFPRVTGYLASRFSAQ